MYVRVCRYRAGTCTTKSCAPSHFFFFSSHASNPISTPEIIASVGDKHRLLFLIFAAEWNKSEDFSKRLPGCFVFPYIGEEFSPRIKGWGTHHIFLKVSPTALTAASTQGVLY